MSMNLTSTWREASRAPLAMTFAASVLTTSTFVPGGGGVGGDGFPVSLPGKISALYIYDGTTLYSISGDIELTPASRISVYAQYDNPTFTVKVYRNGSPSGLEIPGLPANTTLYVTVLMHLREG